MAGFIPIKRLDNCFCSARLGLEGEIFCLDLAQAHWNKINDALVHRKKKAIYLGEAIPIVSGHIDLICPLTLLVESVGGFRMESDYYQIDSALAKSVK
jgi:hypothetical protein